MKLCAAGWIAIWLRWYELLILYDLFGDVPHPIVLLSRFWLKWHMHIEFSCFFYYFHGLSLTSSISSHYGYILVSYDAYVYI